MTKYIKVDWPEYQDYMHNEEFYEVSYYIAEDNSYMIPEDLVENIDSSYDIPCN